MKIDTKLANTRFLHGKGTKNCLISIAFNGFHRCSIVFISVGNIEFASGILPFDKRGIIEGRHPLHKLQSQKLLENPDSAHVQYC